MKFDFIAAQKAKYPIKVLCEVLSVSESGFHAWAKRPESERHREDRRLEARLRSSFQGSDKTYGSHQPVGFGA